MRISRAAASIAFVLLIIIVVLLFPGVTSWAESVVDLLSPQMPYKPSPELFGNDSLNQNASYTQPVPAKLTHLHPQDVDSMNIGQIPRIIHQVCDSIVVVVIVNNAEADVEERAEAVVGCI